MRESKTNLDDDRIGSGVEDLSLDVLFDEATEGGVGDLTQDENKQKQRIEFVAVSPTNHIRMGCDAAITTLT